MGLRLRQEVTRLQAKRKTRESHYMLLGVQKVWGNEPSHFQVNSHCGSWTPKWTFESSKRDFRGQNPSAWKLLYIIGKILKCRCLKWACIVHLDIWNTSYGQKKGRLLKFKNRPNLLACRWRAGGMQHTIRKLLIRAITLRQTSSQSEVYMKSYGFPKSQEP